MGLRSDGGAWRWGQPPQGPETLTAAPGCGAGFPERSTAGRLTPSVGCGGDLTVRAAGDGPGPRIVWPSGSCVTAVQAGLGEAGCLLPGLGRVLGASDCALWTHLPTARESAALTPRPWGPLASLPGI